MNIPIREGVTTSAPSVAVETSDSTIPRKPILVEGGPAPEPITVTPLTVTENGTYDAGENAAYNPVTVNVPAVLPNEYLESEFDLLHSNSTVGFTDSVKNIKLATNKYNQFADGFITGRSAGVMMG